jgi:L-lysine 2,3-aminomutase
VRTIRFGTKALAYWPYRFTTDDDADDLQRLFEEVVASGRQVALMAHVSHHRELATNAVQSAIRRIRSTGAAIYCQAPIMRHINDDADTWIRMWSEQQRLGAVPYYMFMARDTGPREYFEVTIATAVEVFREAFRQLPGLARTVRGPVMSTTPGKLVIDGSPSGEPGNTLQARFVQARDPALVGRPFLVNHPPFAVWADELTAAPGTSRDLAEALSLVHNDAAADGSGAA